MLKKLFGYVNHVGFGEVLDYDFITGKVELLFNDVNEDGNVIHERIEIFDKDDVILIPEIFINHDGQIILNKDVFVTRGKSGAVLNRYMIEKLEDGMFVFHWLNERLEIVRTGEKFELHDKNKEFIFSHLELEDNYYSLIEKKKIFDTFNFNIKVVKSFDGEHYTYFYVCNNKKDSEIDLIKAVFIGADIIEGQEYERKTISYDDYLDMINKGKLKEVSLQEFKNYALGVTYKVTNEPHIINENCDCDCECKYVEKVKEDKPTEKTEEDLNNQKLNKSLDDLWEI